jgi:chromosome segregation ATPase
MKNKEKALLSEIEDQKVIVENFRAEVKELDMALMSAESDLIENKIKLERLEEQLRVCRDGMEAVDVQMKHDSIKAFKERLPALMTKMGDKVYLKR